MEQLTAYLAKEGKKPAQFAEEIGVEPSTITRILRGERKPSPDLARKISEITGISVSDLRPDLYKGFVPVSPAAPEAA
mgnify:FL=1